MKAPYGSTVLGGFCIRICMCLRLIAAVSRRIVLFHSLCCCGPTPHQQSQIDSITASERSFRRAVVGRLFLRALDRLAVKCRHCRHYFPLAYAIPFSGTHTAMGHVRDKYATCKMGLDVRHTTRRILCYCEYCGRRRGSAARGWSMSCGRSSASRTATSRPTTLL